MIENSHSTQGPPCECSLDSPATHLPISPPAAATLPTGVSLRYSCTSMHILHSSFLKNKIRIYTLFLNRF